MDKELIKKEIKKVEDKLKELREKLTYKGRWVPKNGERYWFVKDNGLIDYTKNTENKIDKWNIKTRNCFKTKEKAQEYLDFLETKYELMDLAEELNNGVEIDWDNINQVKFHLYYNNKEKKIVQSFMWGLIGQNIFCLNGDFKEKAIEKIGEDRLIKYFKY